MTAADPTGGSTVEIHPMPSDVEVATGTDLAATILAAAQAAGMVWRDGDVVCVASKVIAKAEGAWIDLPPLDSSSPVTAADGERDARREAARRLAARVVADAEQVLVVQTHHGFVSANAGIDASNVPDGRALRLPDDPDHSAAKLAGALSASTGVEVGVIVTDTFGRPWRQGQVDVALGVAGTAALRDERGRSDRQGRPLDVTVAAVADQVAAAADLVRTKASGTPFVLVRGLPRDLPAGTGADLVRPPEEDLFRHGGPTAAEAAVTGRRTVRAFTSDPVPDRVVEAAVHAATTSPAPHHTRPWRFVDLTDDTRRRLLDVMAAAWRRDLRADGVAEDVIERRLSRSDEILRAAPRLLAPFVDLEGAHDYPDDRARAERDLFLLSGGAALQSLQIVLAAHGFGAAWLASTAFCAPEVRRTLAVPPTWEPLGMIAVGRPSVPVPERRPGDGVDDALIRR